MDPPDTDLLFRRLLTRPGAIPKEWIMNPQFEELSNVFLRRAAVEYGLTKVISGEPDGDAAEADNLESFKRSNHMQARRSGSRRPKRRTGARLRRRCRGRSATLSSALRWRR